MVTLRCMKSMPYIQLLLSKEEKMNSGMTSVIPCEFLSYCALQAMEDHA